MLRFLITMAIIFAVSDVVGGIGVPIKGELIKPANSNYFPKIARNKTNGAPKSDMVYSVFTPVISANRNTSSADYQHNVNNTDDIRELLFGEISKMKDDISEIIKEAISYLADENNEIDSKLNELDDIVSKDKHRERNEHGRSESSQYNDVNYDSNIDYSTFDDFHYDTHSMDSSDSDVIANSSFPLNRTLQVGHGIIGILGTSERCVRGKSWNESRQRCESICTKDQIWDSDKNKCKCPKNKNGKESSGSCHSEIKCPKDQIWDSDKKKCKCPENTKWMKLLAKCVKRTGRKRQEN